MDDPTNLMMISGVLVLDGEVDVELLKKILERRLINVKRFRQRIAGREAGGIAWEEVAVDLDSHLLVERLPDPGGDAELREAVSRLMSQPLDLDRPLWCFHVLRNYKGGSALMGRIHHAIGDGIALILVLLSLTDREPDLALASIDSEDAHHLNPFTALFTHSRHALSEVRQAAEELMPEAMKLLLKPVEAMQATNRLLKGVASLDALTRLTFRSSDPATAFRGGLVVSKRAAWSEPIPMGEIRALVEGYGATVNDVLLTAMAGGLRRYLARRGPVAEKLNFRAAVPVNIRPFEKMGELGNQFGLVFLSLPIGLSDPHARLAELKRRMNALKRSAEPLVAFQILRALGVVPRLVQKAVVSLIAKKATVVMTNVPGPRQPIYLAGRKISSIFFWVPQAGRVGLGISILSYAGDVRLGVGTDAGLVPDPELIIEEFQGELGDMLSRVGG